MVDRYGPMIFLPAYEAGARVSSHSWGSTLGEYYQSVKQMDSWIAGKQVGMRLRLCLRLVFGVGFGVGVGFVFGFGFVFVFFGTSGALLRRRGIQSIV